MNTIQPLTAIFLLLLAVSANATSITVAVASNFAKPMKALAQAYEETHGDQIKLSFNSSGKLYAQILHGAPYDAFFSADQNKSEKLEIAQRTEAKSRFTYAIGRLALWSADPDTIQPINGVLPTTFFEKTELKKIAIANPKLAPYGLAAMQVMDTQGLSEALTPRLVKGENISQAYQFTLTGNAHVGFVALSQILTEGRIRRGSAWVIPEHLHQPIRQDAVIIKRSRTDESQQLINHFFRFIQTPTAQNIIRSYGYHVEQPVSMQSIKVQSTGSHYAH